MLVALIVFKAACFSATDILSSSEKTFDGSVALDVNNSNYVGKVINIENNDIYVDGNINAGDLIWTNPTNYFALFAKDVRVNESSLKGYYADVEFTNSSNELIELFAISSEIVPSSK